jgi:glycosyltransferase involved in cell wall biosynthesis
MSSPLISIITVLYNAADTIENTIKSIANQSYPHIEYIVIDGGSNDGSHAILDRYKNRIDKVIIEKDEGIYDAMNKGLQHANGDWVYFLGADDLLATPTMIEELVKKFEKPDNVYYGDTYLKNANRLYEGKVDLLKFSLCNISHQAIFYPKSVYKTKKYDLTYPYFADHIYNLEIYARNPQKFVYVPMLISIYNDRGRSSTNTDEVYSQNIVRVIYDNFGLPLSVYVWLRRKISSFKNALRH